MEILKDIKMNIDDNQFICRLCLIKPENYENALFDERLKGILKLFFNIDIENEKYSSLVCKCCLQTIESFCEFYDKVLANQNVLRKKPKSYEIQNENFNIDTTIGSMVDIDYETTQTSFHSNNDETTSEDVEREPDEKSNLKEEPFEDSSESDNETEKKSNRKSKKPRQTKTNYDEQIREFMPLLCEQCDKTEIYDTFKELTDHYEMVHKCRGYITCCDKKIYRKDVLVSHITNHIDPEAYKCPECGKISKSKTLLQIHMKIHLPIDKREFQCCICTQRFATKSHLANHEISHLPDSEKKFSCDECGKAFGVKNALTKHKLIHSSERNFVCEDCGRSFAMKANLQYHINNIHSNEPKPKLQCHICKSWFKNNDTLRKHIRQHNDQTEYKCEHCDKVCSSRNVLWCHVRFVHKKIRKHECNVCERKFRRKYELTDHMAKHTGQPLYKCQNCLRPFMYSSHFSQHRKKCQGISTIATENVNNVPIGVFGEF